MRLSPRDPSLASWLTLLGSAHISLKQDKQAIDVLHRAVNENPLLSSAYQLLAAAYALTGEIDAARAALAEFDRLIPNMTIRRSLEAWSVFTRFHRLTKGLQLAGMPLE
jgi:Flp pilus assembly protein TadD